MTSRITRAIIAAVSIAGLGAIAASAAPPLPGAARGIEPIQYDRYGNQPAPGYGAQNPPAPYGYDNRDRDRNDDRDRDRDRDYRGGPHKWRAGEVLPPQLLGRVVADWEDRGLSRPPGGHQWMRVGLQFVLVRGSDRKIARVVGPWRYAVAQPMDHSVPSAPTSLASWRSR